MVGGLQQGTWILFRGFFVKYAFSTGLDDSILSSKSRKLFFASHL
jgi:hypothetical protein